MMIAVAMLIISYLLGSITCGYYLVRILTGRDIRTLASGNPGSRNVGRLLGTKGFILTFIGDAGKGLLAVWLAERLTIFPWLPAAALLATVVGHIWPVQLRFRGGKGFATFAGGMVLLNPPVLLAGLALCVLLYPLMRGTTRCGLVALTATPLLMSLWSIRKGAALLTPESILFCLLVVIVLVAHRTNIRQELGYVGQDGG